MKLDAQQERLHKHFEGAWLGSRHNVGQFLLWNTYYRRNLHRFAMEYFGIQLFPYQQAVLYFIGVCPKFVSVCARLTAKSYLAAVAVLCVCALYPGTQAVVVSRSVDQAKIILSEKLLRELRNRYPKVNLEISSFSDGNDVEVKFKSGSVARALVLGKRGFRSTFNLIDEVREVDKKAIDEVVSPYKMVRQPAFLARPEYENRAEFQEEPREAYLSSSVDASHWLFAFAEKAAREMLSGKPSVFFAADYALTLKHGLRTREQMLRERGSCDHLTWLTEYENLALRSREDAYFTYASLRARQTLKIAFYPRSPFGRERAMPKQHSEFRVLSCDIAAVDAKNNDFSAFSLLRVFPEPTLRVHVPYIERSRGYELRGQAVRIRQLMRDFQADYLVLDTRNVGQGVYQALARVLPDEERGVEYAPLCAMNDERMMRVPGADPIVFSVQGSAKLNSDIAVNMQYFLSESMLELLAPANEAGKPIISPKLLDDPDAVLFYESPYLNTMLAVAEMAGLTYERLASTGMVRVVERAGKTKDLYSSLSYGCWFAREMANDLAGGGEAEEIPFGDCCFGVLNF